MNNAKDDGWVLREWRAATGIVDRDPAIVDIGATLTMGRATFTSHGDRFPLRLVQSILGTKKVTKRKTGTPAKLMALGAGGQVGAYHTAMTTGRWAA